MLVAVTGASGHVGANLVRTLIARGAKVRVLIHGDARSLEGLDVERVKGDVTDPSSVESLVDGAERVFHLAAKIILDQRKRKQMEETNIGGPRVVTAACKKAGVKRLVHFSSIHAYAAEPRHETIDEARPLASGERLVAYDATKSAGERVVRDAIDAGLDAVIVNPTAILGPYDYGPSHMGEVLLDLYHGKLPGLVDGGFSWVDVRDVVEGAIAAAERAPRGARYLLCGQWRPIAELAKVVEQVTGKRAPWMVSPMWLAQASAPFAEGFARLLNKRPLFTPASLVALKNHRHISSGRAEREIGYSSRPLEDTIRDTFDWFRAEGKLK